MSKENILEVKESEVFKDLIIEIKNEMHEKILRSVGATKVIYPEAEMGKRVAQYIVADNFADWIELSSKYSLVEMQVPAAWKNHTLQELQIREKYNLNVIGIRDGDQVTVKLDPGAPMKAGVELIVVGENSDLEHFQK